MYQDLSPLVQSSLDGYNVTIFAYGQTGSGKTHTMFGPSGENLETSDDSGMIVKAVQDIFSEISKMKESGWTHTVSASCVEIYNEEIFDLIGSKSGKRGGQKCELRLKRPGDDGVICDSDVVVSGLTHHDVFSPSDVMNLLNKVSKSRSVGATACNDRSSRSHTVFQLRVQGVNENLGMELSSILSLVDLAGSERLHKSKADGERLKETQTINASLSNLATCINAIAQKKAHIPYRNSKLTHLLQGSLGGESKTLFFINVAPGEENVNVSVAALIPLVDVILFCLFVLCFIVSIVFLSFFIFTNTAVSPSISHSDSSFPPFPPSFLSHRRVSAPSSLLLV